MTVWWVSHLESQLNEFRERFHPRGIHTCVFLACVLETSGVNEGQELVDDLKSNVFFQLQYDLVVLPFSRLLQLLPQDGTSPYDTKLNRSITETAKKTNFFHIVHRIKETFTGEDSRVAEERADLDVLLRSADGDDDVRRDLIPKEGRDLAQNNSLPHLETLHFTLRTFLLNFENLRSSRIIFNVEISFKLQVHRSL